MPFLYLPIRLLQGGLQPPEQKAERIRYIPRIPSKHFRSPTNLWVESGARTHDTRNHNPMLCQLSYDHHLTNSCCLPFEQPSIGASLYREYRGTQPHLPSKAGAKVLLFSELRKFYHTKNCFFIKKLLKTAQCALPRLLQAPTRPTSRSSADYILGRASGSSRQRCARPSPMA